MNNNDIRWQYDYNELRWEYGTDVEISKEEYDEAWAKLPQNEFNRIYRTTKYDTCDGSVHYFRRDYTPEQAALHMLADARRTAKKTHRLTKALLILGILQFLFWLLVAIF